MSATLSPFEFLARLADLSPPPRRRQKNATQGGEARHSGNRCLGAGSREHAAHKPLICRATLADVPETGLSFGMRGVSWRGPAGRCGILSASGAVHSGRIISALMAPP
jgi:hypothetical protein